MESPFKQFFLQPMTAAKIGRRRRKNRNRSKGGKKRRKNRSILVLAEQKRKERVEIIPSSSSSSLDQWREDLKLLQGAEKGKRRTRRDESFPVISSEHSIAWLCGDPSNIYNHKIITRV